ncbi:ATP synthase subunit B family protein [Bifidobacterium eulemuris]|uniref:Cell division protein n=1 Tax=Bifidobacterium eulemuris TaxID=1765219 RepID=A0A261G5N6_9BIFI|nr:cell division protein [Bifidobacterium eulemuris]OZG66515.1 cell division protein [Bifidobacterium eulemuris]
MTNDTSNPSDGRPTGYVDLTGARDTDLFPPLAQDDTEASDPPTPSALFSAGAMPDMREGLSADDAEGQSHAEFTTVYDIIDDLDRTLDEAKGGLFTPNQVKVDRDVFTDRLTELKKMLPVQLERASALMREAERRLESAQTQANAIIASAQSRASDMVREANEQAQFLAGQENVTEIARQKARAILDQAQAKSDHLTQGADQYCSTMMEGLQQQLNKLSQDVQAGINVLNERQRAAASRLPSLDEDDQPQA